MARACLSVIAGAALLCGCAWVLPKPTERTTATGASGADATCSIDLSEARRAIVARVDAAGIAVPAIITGADGAPADRTIRNGSLVTLRALPPINDQRTLPATETAPMTISLIGGAGSDPVEIRGESVVRLRPRGESPVATGDIAGAKRPPGSSPADEFVIYKADVPDPNRPTTCDTVLRGGDFVYLRTIVPSTWVEVRDRTLVSATPALTPTAHCRESDQSCYTDPSGGLLCARMPTCVAWSGQ
jgi:hypothetical protein